MKKLKQMISFIMVLCLLCGTVSFAETDTLSEEKALYERMLEAYRAGNQMDDWVVEARKNIAEELGLLDELDERFFLSVNYVNQNNLDLTTDEKLNLLVEMASEEEEEMAYTYGMIQSMSVAVSHGAVNATQMARVSGAGNGYFTISNGGGSADSYGYCAQNSLSFWSNGGTKAGNISEWNNAEARKALYYGPGGPGYAGPYYGSVGADMDYVTFTVGQLNGDTNNNTKANTYRSLLSSKTDPLNYGYKAYKADIASPYQDVAFLNYSPVTTTLTIYKRSQTDTYSGDGYKYLSGAVFDLYSYNGTSYNTRVATSVDNGNGSYTFKNVPITSSGGWYLVKERTAKAGYQNKYVLYDSLDEDRYNHWGGRVFKLNTSNLTWSCYSTSNIEYPNWGFTFLDYPEEVTVTITKVDSTDESKILSGAKFSLYAYQNRSNVKDWYKIGDFTENLMKDQEGNTITDEFGNALGNGTYSITFPFDKATYIDSRYTYSILETQTPDGYVNGPDISADNPEEGYKIAFTNTGEGETEFTIGNLPNRGEMGIIKSSADPEITEGNLCYSLEGAEYGVYSDEECTNEVGTLITDESGLTPYISLVSGTYWVKEKVSPKGFALDLQTYSIKVEAGSIETLNVVDIPQMDPVGVLLGKINKETNDNKPVNTLSLQGAWYEFKFYGVLLEDSEADPGELGYEPLKTWVFETDEDGFTYYDEIYKVSGPDLYYLSTGVPLIPIGTLTIQEIKPPEGWLINEQLYVRQITAEGVLEDVNTYNYPIVPETTFDLDVIKLQEGTDVGVPGTVFEHTKPDGTTEILTTDENGRLSFKALNYGDHELRELTPTEGYIKNNNVIKYTIATDNSVTFTSENDDTILLEVSEEGNVQVTVYEEIYPFSLIIHKQNDKGVALSHAEFTLYSDAECTQIVQVGITDENGILKFDNLTAGKKYYLKETKEPAGYIIPKDVDGNPLVTEIQAFIIPTLDEFNLYVNGELYDFSSEGAYSVTGTKETYELNMTVVNETGYVLPQTGSSTTLIIMMAGVLLFAFGILNMNRRKKMKSKILKTVLSLSLAITLAASGISANAASVTAENGVANFNRGDAQITIVGNEEQSLNGKKFNVYRLFNAENSVGMESINYTFNPDYKTALQTIVGEKLGKEANTVTEYEVIDYIQSLNNNEVEGAQAAQTNEGSYSDFRYFIEALRDEIVKEGVEGDVVTVTSTNSYNSFTISGLEYGYYIVDEITAVSETHQAASLCIVNTANPNASVTIKSDYPTLIHKIQEDDNKASVGNDGWNDIGDYEIGQTVPYTYESGIPDINGYSEYYYAWHDVMDEALTFNPDSVTITISDGTSSYELNTDEFSINENPGNGETFLIEIENIKAIVDREFDNLNALNENVYGQKVVVTFDATLNDKAAKDMGRSGYENDVRLEFSNNPDSDGTAQTGFTPWDTVVCFTYQIDVLKTNDKDLKLEGAKFRLYSDADCTEEVYVKETENGYNVINRDSVGGTTSPSEAIEMVSDENGSIIINGVDDGVYYLKETKAPTGYRKLLDAIVLTVDSTFTDERNTYVKGEGATDKTLEALAASAHVKTFLDGVYSEDDITLVTDAETGAVNITVINTVGTKLPVTGSAATILMLAAGAGLIMFFVFTKKKEDKKEA